MTTPNAAVEPEYELKHRLTGAAILIVLAVVIIPLLLSEPALEANSKVDEQGVAVQTFRSRIVPLNLNNVNGGDTTAGSDLTAGSVDERKPALLDLTVEGGKVQSNESGSASAEKATDSQKTALVMTNNSSKEKTALKPVADKKIPAADAKPASSVKVAATKAPEKAPGSKTAIKAAPDEATTGDSGWVVRVGTFSKKANVDSVSKLLNNSGFNPKTKQVDTSLGESTRVWLGPFARRETADKISDRLKSLIGEKGYVTRTSS